MVREVREEMAEAEQQGFSWKLTRAGPEVGLLLWGLTLALAASLGPAEAEEALRPLDGELLGVWRQLDADTSEAWTAEITAAHWSAAMGDRLERRSPVIGQNDAEIVIAYYGNHQRRRFELNGEILTITYTPAKTALRPSPKTVHQRYVRQATRPAVFDLRPLPLGHATPIAERLSAIRGELVQRGERDQAARRFYKPCRSASAEELEGMREVDADNVAYLTELVAEVGWIDTERFGAAASRAAWLMVQHSRHLALMRAVLPRLENEASAGHANRTYFARLYDRTQLYLGRKQRFGSQAFWGPDGMFIAPLEDPAGVDRRRAELGLGTFAQRREALRAMNCGRELPVRTEF